MDQRWNDTMSRINRRQAEEWILKYGSEQARKWLEEYRKRNPDKGLKRDPGEECL